MRSGGAYVAGTAFAVLFCIVGLALWGLPFYYDFMVRQFGWTRAQDSLKVSFYQAASGKPVGQVDATRSPSITRVESFRIWPTADKEIIQIGRFTFDYAIEGK